MPGAWFRLSQSQTNYWSEVATISCRSAGPIEARDPWHSAIVPPTEDGPARALVPPPSAPQHSDADDNEQQNSAHAVVEQ